MKFNLSHRKKYIIMSNKSLHFILIVLVILFSISACTDKMSPSSAKVNKKRVAPINIDPVILNGIRFEAVHWGKSRGLKQNGGFISAVNIASDKEIWLLKVYKINYDGDKEQDKQDCFITELYLDKNGLYLYVKNESNEMFEINISSKKIKRIK